MNRKKIVAGNWKMNMTIDQSNDLINELKLISENNVEVKIAPSFTNLYKAVAILKDSEIEVIAQNVHSEMRGAFTGEISTEMLKSIGVNTTIIGHSERRKYFDETDLVLSKKVKASIENSLNVIFCVGEELSEGFQKLLKPPHCLEWEKMFYPFIIFSKKRYVGNLYEHDVYKFKQKSMGIVLKRRDNANIVKIIYGGIINKILNGEGVKKSLEFLHNSLEKLSNGEYPLEELIVTKTLRGFYKNPQQIAHKVLADRMKKRDPGSAPQSNDRVPYVYIQTKEDKNKKLLQGEKIEDPKFIIENNLTPDYGHYITNQIMKPCLQLYSMVLEDLDGYKHKNDKNYWKKKAETLMEEKQDQKKVDDKIKQLREKEVEELLFSKYLTKIDNKKKGIKTIGEFF